MWMKDALLMNINTVIVFDSKIKIIKVIQRETQTVRFVLPKSLHLKLKDMSYILKP